MDKVKPRPVTNIRMSKEETAVADIAAHKLGHRSRSEFVRELIADKAKKLRIKRNSPEVLSLLAAGTEGATDGE